MKDPLLALVHLKSLEEIVEAAKETIRRHRRRFLQRNMRPCPLNCKGADMVGHKVVGCMNCGSQNSEQCIKESTFVPLFTKEELAQQFADQLRNPEVLLREYRDITVFLWVLGAFDRQKKTVDEHIVSKVEQREKPKSIVASAPAGDPRPVVGQYDSKQNDQPTANGNTKPVQRPDGISAQTDGRRTRVVSRTAPGIAKGSSESD